MISLLLLAGCGEPPPVVALPPTQLPPPAASASAEAPGLINVSAVSAPASVSIDGDLGEWGALARGGAASSLAFALTGNALLIAADLHEASRDGIWLSVTAPAAEVPPIGDITHGGGVEAFDCENERGERDGSYYSTGKKLPPESAAACRKLVAAYDELSARLTGRFARRFKIDHEGVRSVKAGTADLVPIEGARATWKPGPTGATVEVSLPLLALPREIEAPVTQLGVRAVPSTEKAPPEIGAEASLDGAASGPRPRPPAEAMIKLPAPVSFEPHGALRARVFKAVNDHAGYYGERFYTSVGLSYQPGDPLHVESLPRDRGEAIRPTEELLYEKIATLGDLEVASAHAFLAFFAIYRKGQLVDVIAADPQCARDAQDASACGHATVRGVIPRAGEIHVLTSYPGESFTFVAGTLGAHPGGWFITAIAPDGTHRMLTPLTPEPVVKLERAKNDTALEYPSYSAGTEYANPALDSFGWRGDRAGDTRDKRIGLEAAYRWDEAKKSYTLSWRRFPLPPEQKKPGARKK